MPRATKSMVTNLRIYYLGVTSKTNRNRYRCTTVATDLDEAVRRAACHYGPLDVTSSGTRSIPHGDSDLPYPGGQFLPSHNDQHLRASVLRALQDSRR